ncbi:MAG: flagellar hook-associated protein FlgL [Polaromonas sp.]|nr:flagellar hook-associated protein FlgL [Polaromonas sp.]
MKISTSALFDRATQQMGNVQASLAKSQAQLASSKQIVTPSDAPNQAASIQRLQSLMSRQDSYAETLTAVQTRLQGEETALQSVSNLLLRVKDISVQAASDTLGATDRHALAIEMGGLRDQMVSLANTQDSMGNYLFAGSRVSQPAFAPDATGALTYQGDQTRMRVSVGDQRSVQINRSGSDAFVRVVREDAKGEKTGIGFFQALDQLTAAVQNSDRVNMQRGIGEMDALQNGVTLALAQIGTDMNVVDAQTAVLDETRLSLKTTLSSIKDLDYAEAITQMNKQLLALEAAQSSFGKITKLSLFNYIN